MTDQSEKLRIDAALAKQRQGQDLTRAEAALLAKARQRVMADQLRAIVPKLFCELFAIQNLQRYQWEEALDVPCGRGRETIDLFAVGAAFKRIMSRRMELASDSPEISDLKKTKLQEEIEKLREHKTQLRMENELTAGRRLPRESIIEPLERMAVIIRGVGDQLARKTTLSGVEAQRMLNNAIDQYERELATIRES